ncbi:inositol phosphate phosphatase SopB [Bordetella sp. BOR01]|uniref:inositol phosphate phosphatase SopB n=1 Tax=Bordetella sp. BOR01 TaxID=2854779 RepID=UPI001C437827|nr:inositol phosphate phosphatase SopB [Bordetella sp. BOR01]MBV7486818.1 hypothetical protein [Bordetella sp. BOR01]
MPLELHHFRTLSTGTASLDREITLQSAGEQQKVAHGEVRLAGRLLRWTAEQLGVTRHDREEVQQARGLVKQAFFDVLARTEGRKAAKMALQAAGLPKDWRANDRPLTSCTISEVLDHAQQRRAAAIKKNEVTLQAQLPPASDTARRDERSAILAAVRGHPDYGCKPMSGIAIQHIADQARDSAYAKQAAHCAARYPGLTALATALRLDPHALTIVDQIKATLNGIELDKPTLDAFGFLDRSATLLHATAWNQTDMGRLEDDLTQCREELNAVLAKLDDRYLDPAVTQAKEPRQEKKKEEEKEKEVETKPDKGKERLYGNLPDAQDTTEVVTVHLSGSQHDDLDADSVAGGIPTPSGLEKALRLDIECQRVLIESKLAYLQELRLNDPLSERAVAHSNLIWAQAGMQIIAGIEKKAIDKGILPPDEQLRTVRASWQRVVDDAARAHMDTGFRNPSVPAPGEIKQSVHPATQGKRRIVQELQDMLVKAGAEKDTVEKWTGKAELHKAQLAALSTSDAWLPLSRTMLVVRDGAVSQYTSKITPAQHWNADFQARYTEDGELRGVPSADAGNIDHARNLKVSELRDSSGRTLATVVGHGVLDMWDIHDPFERALADARGAKEVIDLAVASNPRLRQHASNIAIEPARDGKGEGESSRQPGPRTMRVTHVSVNLISPDTIRNAAFDTTNLLSGGYMAVAREFAEKDFTLNQFRAFKANSGPARTIQMVDADERIVQRRFDIDTITFSFGINGWATSGNQSRAAGVWSNVHEHNTENMIKLVGDLGAGKDGAAGARPGGFIGQVYDRVKAGIDNAATPESRQRLMSLNRQLQVQTDVVRHVFTTEAFAKGGDDPAKMGREILALQVLAERSLSALQELELGGEDMAATLSKGCKSDKDRGGVTDVELKSKLILQDMGGDMEPDTRLVGDDQELYYTVSASSGQLENQRWNTGLGGSKEAGKLKERIPQLQVRRYLAGLGKFAEA